MRRHAFTVYCLALVATALLLTELVLLPRLYGLPRATLLNGFAARPGELIDGQVINAMGFSGDVIAGPDTDDTLRVLLLGSSTLFNRQLGDRLKAALQQRSNKRVELLNAGIRSHTSRADLLKLQLLAPLGWDYVLFYDSINDLWANHVLPEDFDNGYAQLDSWYQRNWLLDHSLLARYGYNSAMMWLRWFNQQTGNRLLTPYQFVFPKKPYVNAANFASLQSYENNVRDIIALARQHGATPVLVSFAFHLPDNYSRQAFLDQQLDYSNPDNYDSREVNNWGPPDYVRTALQENNRILKRLASTEQIPLIDIDASMSGHGQWFGDVCHFNDSGVDVFVDTVSAALLPSIQLPATQKPAELSSDLPSENMQDLRQ